MYISKEINNAQVLTSENVLDVWEPSIDTSDPTFDMYKFVVFLGPVEVEVDLRYFKQDSNLTFVGIDLPVPRDLIKWTITVLQNQTNRVGTPGDSFEIHIALASGQPLEGLQIVSDSPQMGMTTYDLQWAGFSGRLEMFDRAELDGVVGDIEHRIDPATMTLIIRTPYFADSLVYDPNLALLADSISAAEDGGGDGTDKTVIIVLVTVLGGLALIVVVTVTGGFALFAYLRKRRTDKRVVQRMERVARSESILPN